MKKSVAIIGGGPSALLAASFLDTNIYDVTIYEKNKALGKKFLVAGNGGFNLTHSEPIEEMQERYLPNGFLKVALNQFTNTDLRAWLKEIGIPTFVGTSKRVYPEKGIMPITVLNKIKEVIEKNKVTIQYNKTWKGWTENNELIFEDNEFVKADYTLFALGGGSWKITGSDGNWLETFKEKGITTLPFIASNCAFKVDWTNEFLKINEGKPLKNIALSCHDKTQKGELVITKFGLEGNAIYALSPEIQAQLAEHGKANILIDLKPSFRVQDIYMKLNSSGLKTTEILKRKLKLSPAQIQLLKANISKEEFISHDLLSEKIKFLPITITSAATLDEAISTTGGISINEVDENFELKAIKNSFCIGEMLDWNGPTGGYLLQASFSMGVFVANYLNSKD